MRIEHDGVTIEIEKPVVDGWEFLNYRPAQDEEKYYRLGQVCTWHGDMQTEKSYWIATRKPEKKQRVVRHEINMGVVEINSATVFVDELYRYPNFIGFEFGDNEVVYHESIRYLSVEDGISFNYPTAKEIESGAVEVRHVRYALFLEEV